MTWKENKYMFTKN